jgi:co-chaperonin GroES (HSP10)
MKIQAVNNYLFVIRDKEEKEQGGLIIPGRERVKPHEGTVFSIGDLVGDKKIKGAKNKKCLFHKGVGFDVEYGGTTYLVLNSEHIIAILENDSPGKP